MEIGIALNVSFEKQNGQHVRDKDALHNALETIDVVFNLANIWGTLELNDRERILEANETTSWGR